MRIRNDISSMQVINQMNRRSGRIACHVQRISSGKRINSADDDAVGVVKAERIKAGLRGIAALQRIAAAGQDMVAIRDGELSNRADMLQRLREVSVSASSNYLSDEQRQILAKEFEVNLEALLEDMRKSNGLSVRIDADTEEMFLSNGQQIYFDGKWTDTLPSLAAGSIKTQGEASETIGLMDYYLNAAAQEGASLGVLSSVISSKMNILSQQEILLTEQLSLLEDADLAEEMIGYAKESLLQQASILVLAHIKLLPENVLHLLEES